ncbi:hypothetical protein LDENG_00193210 [Lucifuga dentata]|nr:hypothetical protein LDENG_00193210 [Lucifuga dentata]
MVIKRIHSEYTKKFKDPKWETYTKCYEEMLKYRMTRRLLEHTHNPWFWNGSDTDSDSGGTSPPPPSKNQTQVRAETSCDRPGAEVEEYEGARMDRQREGMQSRSTVPVPRLPLPEQEEDAADHGCQHDGAREMRVLQEEREEQKTSSTGTKQLPAPHQDRDQETKSAAAHLHQNKPSKTSKYTWRTSRVRPAPPRAPRGDSIERRHPFVLYASGEKDADMAAKKTHSVCPAASTKEIHESALRAKTRREVERQVQTQRVERRRAKSADLDKTRTKPVQPEFNPWLTEYMRCFSARSR